MCEESNDSQGIGFRKYIENDDRTRKKLLNVLPIDDSTETEDIVSNNTHANED